MEPESPDSDASGKKSKKKDLLRRNTDKAKKKSILRRNTELLEEKKGRTKKEKSSRAAPDSPPD